MRITDAQIVSYMLEDAIVDNDIITYLRVINKLFKKYGKIIFLSKFQNEILNVDKDIAYLIKLLIFCAKLDSKSLKNITNLLKNSMRNYKDEFIVQVETDDYYDKVKLFLDKKFSNSIIEKNISKSDSIRISGEGWYYNRALDQDIKKLLGI